jgi:hypothetical protein
MNTPQTQETFLLQTNPRGEFQFPKGGMYDSWVQWNVGHSKQQISALRSLTPGEFQFIEEMAKWDSERWCQRGTHKFKDKGRQAGKHTATWSFL